MTPDISVVVPTRNRVTYLQGLLRALDAQTHPNFEVIVVDDASTDGTPGVLAGWAGEQRRRLRLETSAGSYAARNAGWRSAAGRVIAFTDDDCVPSPGWLGSLAAALEGDDTVAAQGMTVTDPARVTPFTHQIEQRTPGPPYRTCNMAYRRSVLEELGGFDDRLRWYEDNILGLRARRLGPIAWAPGAVVTHPPRPRQWRARDDWLDRFAADALHRQALRELGAERLTPPGRLLSVTLWILRPLAKQSVAHARYLLRHPRDYLAQLPPMLREKRALLAALRRPAPTGHEPGEPLTPLPAEPSISVVVVTRDRPESLELTLEALASQTYPAHEVTVVDHSPRCTARSVAEQHAARYLTASDMTLGAARGVGTDTAGGEIVAFTDDDCLPHPDWLRGLAGAFRDQPTLHGVQGRTEAERGPAGSHAIRVIRPDPLYQTCNMAYRREAIGLAGGVDRQFVGWFEDTALGARVLAHGPIGFAGDAVVVHRAMPRRTLDRATWRRLLADERRLARCYPDFYHGTRGPGFWPVVVGRWLLGSPLKALLFALPRLPENPGAYGRLAAQLAHERKELLRAMIDLAR